VFPLLATFLLTGGRRAEVLGLELADVSFPRNTVTFRPNRFRRLKTATSARAVPLWPQLRDILTAYLSVRTAAMVLQDAPSTSLLFPSFRTGKENRLVELRKIFDRVSVRGGWKAGDVRSRALRHTYCSSRLRLWTVGHL
jgi:integrase